MRVSIRARPIAAATLITSNGLLFGFTAPDQISAAALLAVFMLLAVNLYALQSVLARGLQIYRGSRLGRRQLRIAMAISVAGLIALQSIGQLGTRDMVVMILLGLLGHFYVSYQRKLQPYGRP